VSHKKRKHKLPKTPPLLETPMDAVTHEANTPIQRRFWKDWSPMERMTLVLAIFAVVYSIAACWLPSVSRGRLDGSALLSSIFEVGKLIVGPQNNHSATFFLEFSNIAITEFGAPFEA
jgi:hypothetical protein